jgi:hypothetical protein
MHQKKNSLCDVDTRMVRTVREKRVTHSHTEDTHHKYSTDNKSDNCRVIGGRNEFFNKC